MKRAAYVILLLCSLALLAFAEKDMENVSQSQRGALGKIDSGNDRNGNTDAYIRTWHMAPPADGHAYVVWFQPDDGQPQNNGVIRIDDERKGAFRTTTPLRDFKVLITMEPDARAQLPTGEVILRSEIDR